MATLVTACSLSVLDGLSGGVAGAGGGSSNDASQPVTDALVDISIDPADAATEDSAPNDHQASEGGDDAWSQDANDEIEAGDASKPPPDGTLTDRPTDGVIDGPLGCPADCTATGYCLGSECVFPSCKARRDVFPGTPNGVYWLDADGDTDGGQPPYRAYCEMGEGGGGWTLVMKVDGTASTFLHDSPLWNDETSYQPDYADLDGNEAKLPSYVSVQFTEVRIGIREGTATRWLTAPVASSSFRLLMTSGYHATTLGRDAWKALSNAGSLQRNCNREGFNVVEPEIVVRIGIVANDQSNCSTCDSWIGFGGNITGRGGEFSCGNVASRAADNGDRAVPLFGYLMVR